MLRFSRESERIEVAPLDEMLANFLSSGYGTRTARFKALVQHLRIGFAFMKAIHATMRCKSDEMCVAYFSLSKFFFIFNIISSFDIYAKICYENEQSPMWYEQAHYVRDGIDALKSTRKLANGCTALIDASMDDMLPANQSKHEFDTEGKVSRNYAQYVAAYYRRFQLINVINVAYSRACDGNFDEAIRMIEKIKPRYPSDACPMVRRTQRGR